MYLDPGSGSVILQVALAALLGLGVVTRLFWRKILTLLGKNKNRPAPGAEDDNDPDSQ